MTDSDLTRNLRGYVGLSLIWLTLFGVFVFVLRQPSAQPIEILPPPTALPTPIPAPTPTPGPIHVDVAGEVLAPGVYALAPGSLVADAISLAGGPTQAADLDRINKAVALLDGMQVYVPGIDQPAPVLLLSAAPQVPATAPGQEGLFVDGIVNINTATLEGLDTLPGIGPATAQRIVDGRPYGTIEDIMRVKGIGQATLDKIKDRITVQ
jgi:competence protein ComEA